MEKPSDSEAPGLDPDACLTSARTLSVAIVVVLFPIVVAIVDQSSAWGLLIQARKAFVEEYLVSNLELEKGDFSKLKGHRDRYEGIGYVQINEVRESGEAVYADVVVFPDFWFLDHRRVPVWAVRKSYSKDLLKSAAASGSDPWVLSEIAASLSLAPWEFEDYRKMYRAVEWKVFGKMRSSTVGIPETPIQLDWVLASWATVVITVVMLISIQHNLRNLADHSLHSKEPWLLVRAESLIERAFASIWTMAFTFSPVIALGCLYISECLYAVAFRGGIELVGYPVMAAYTLLTFPLTFLAVRTWKTLRRVRALHRPDADQPKDPSNTGQIKSSVSSPAKKRKKR